MEVDLEYTEKLHDLHKDYPLVPEIMSVSEDMLSQHQKELHYKYYGKEAKDEDTKKLIFKGSLVEKLPSYGPEI